MRGQFFNVVIAILLTPVVLSTLPLTFAQVMESSSYRIQSDSVNFGGGFSSSTNYSLESTAGEIATGEGESATYKLKAGYQQMQEVYIALAGAQNVLLSPSIPGITGGTSNGSTTVTVTTDSRAGYSLTIAGSGIPAMVSGANSILDYAPSGGNPDFTFTTDVTDSQFGYSPEGVDVATRFKDNGVNTCGGGAFDTSLACWDGLSTTERGIALRTTANHPLGSTTTIHFRVGIGGGVNQPSGVYTATTTLTALPL